MEPKGLTNPKGANNCWLNATVQLLWHLDAFRSSVIKLSGFGHFKCQQERCVYCHVKSLMFEYEHTEELSIPPNMLRNALAQTCSRSFATGKLGDPIEAYQAVLHRLHAHLVDKQPDNHDDSCEALHCIVHRKFAMNIVEQNVCERCQAAGEPTPSWELFRWISSRDVLELRDKSQENFVAALKNVASSRCEAKRPGSATPCGGRSQPSKALLNAPDVFALCIGWDTHQSRSDEIKVFLDILPVEIALGDIFQHALDANAAAKLTLVGIVCYYGMHYSLFFYHSTKKTWIYLDDSKVTEIGSYWDWVKLKIIKGHHQPCMVVYTKLAIEPINTRNAPKFTEIDTNAFQEDLTPETSHAEDEDYRREREAQEEADLEYARELEKLEIQQQKQEIENEKRRIEEATRQKLLNEQKNIYETIKRQNHAREMEQRCLDYTTTSVPSELLTAHQTPGPLIESPPPPISTRTSSVVTGGPSNRVGPGPFPPAEWKVDPKPAPSSFPPASFQARPEDSYRPERYSEPKTEPLIRIEKTFEPTRTRSNTSDLIRLSSVSDGEYSTAMPSSKPPLPVVRHVDRNKEKLTRAVKEQGKRDSMRRRNKVATVDSVRSVRPRDTNSPTTSSDRHPQLSSESQRPASRAPRVPVSQSDSIRVISYQPNREVTQTKQSFPKSDLSRGPTWNIPKNQPRPTAFRKPNYTSNEPYIGNVSNAPRDIFEPTRSNSPAVDYNPSMSSESHDRVPRPGGQDLIDMDKPVDSLGMHNVKKVLKTTGTGLRDLSKKMTNGMSNLGHQVSSKMKNNNQGAPIPRYPEIDNLTGAHGSTSNGFNLANSNHTAANNRLQESDLSGVMQLSEGTTDNNRRVGRRK